MAFENYRTLSEGVLKVYGNSVEIKENFFVLDEEKRKELIKSELETIHKNLDQKVTEYDRKFEDHVLKHGHDFEKIYFPPFLRKQKEKPEPPKRKRGDISGFSRSSRRRLLRKLNQLNPDNTGQFFHITLTYPKQFPKDGETHKADLDAFIKRCKRRFSDSIAYLWKLEFQKRGAPHYHLIVLFPKAYKIQYLRNWFSQNWYEVAQRYWEFKLENHKNAGVSVDAIKSLRRAGAYLSKYIAKDEGDTPENQGRYWGCSRNWGEVVLNKVKLTGKQLIEFRRLTKRFLKGQGRMQKLVTQPMNLVVFGHWSFFKMAIDWVKSMH